MDDRSPVGIMRAEYMARALSTSEKFLYEDMAEASEERRASAMNILFDFITSIGVPEFLYDEISQLYDSAVVETLSINTKNGAELPVVHIYLEWQANWSNWLEAYIDEDTEQILYLYVSGSCISDEICTDGKDSQMPQLDKLASFFGEYSGYSQLSTEYTENPNENALTALYSDGSAEANYKINCIYYEGTMYDIKIEPLP
ncbi:MAG: hypothetical protein EOM14_07565 [Clostridia bacterium]|nr:hypothetical protein [Clostridia bacterium]